MIRGIPEEVLIANSYIEPGEVLTSYSYGQGRSWACRGLGHQASGNPTRSSRGLCGSGNPI